MQAATYRRYGPPEVLRIEDLPIPTPARGEVRVRVLASSVTSGDARMRGCRGAGVFWLPLRLMLGLFRPRQPIIGMDFAGRIDALGAGASRFHLGQAVFGIVLHGANAEYLTLPEAGAIAAAPAGLSPAQAAAVPFGALAALVFLRDVARLRAGEHVLVHGASGAVGVFAVQLARHFGARVTAVCSGANADLVRSLGAHSVIDYVTTDFADSGERYDVILDTVGGSTFARGRRVLARGGRQVFLIFGLAQMAQMLWTSWRPGPRVVCGLSGTAQADLVFIRDLVEAGHLRPVVDGCYPLRDIVQAHRRVDSGRKRGSLVVTV